MLSYLYHRLQFTLSRQPSSTSSRPSSLENYREKPLRSHFCTSCRAITFMSTIAQDDCPFSTCVISDGKSVCRLGKRTTSRRSSGCSEGNGMGGLRCGGCCCMAY